MRGVPAATGHGMKLTACQGHSAVATLLLVQIKLLVEEGGADVWVRDRWGKTAYDEARRVGATSVAEYLKAIMDRCRRFP